MISLYRWFLIGLLTIESDLSAAEIRKVSIALIEPDDSPQLHNITKRRAGIDAALAFALEDKKDALTKKGIEVCIKNFDIAEIPIGARTSLTQAQKSNAVIAIGLSTSNVAVFASPNIAHSDLTIISPYATDSELKKAYPRLITMAPDNDELATKMVQFVANKGFEKSLAVVAWDCPYCKNIYQRINQDDPSVNLIKTGITPKFL